MGRDNVRTRVLLRDDVTEDRVEDVALDLDWIPLGSREATDNGPYEQIWEDEVAGVYVHYVWDDLVRMAYLLVQGTEVIAVETAIRAVLPTYAYGEVIGELRTATGREPVIDAICRIAVLQPNENVEIVRLLLNAADNEDPEIRRAVITATGYLEWRALLERIAIFRDHDPDAVVRADAALVLDAVT